MEYRIHERNNLKLSIIGIDFSKLIFIKENNFKIEYDQFFNNLNSLNINFISFSIDNTNLIASLSHWEKKNTKCFIKSLLVGTKGIDSELNDETDLKTIFLTNRFSKLGDTIKFVIEKNEMIKIDFLTLFYPKLVHFKEENLKNDISKLKQHKIIDSFGIRCQYLTDAIRICNKVDYIDHLEIEIELNTSPELISSVFKMAHKKTIPVFCLLRENSTYLTGNWRIKYNELSNLLQKGIENFTSELEDNMPKKINYPINLMIRKFIPYDFQTLMIAEENIEKLRELSTFTPLTNEEEQVIQKSFEPQMYVSPKKHQ